MAEGVVVEEGIPEQIFKTPRHERPGSSSSPSCSEASSAGVAARHLVPGIDDPGGPGLA
jgi:hypothetical protein